MRRFAVGLCATLVLLSGCSGVAQQDASAVAVAFVHADAARECELLAPSTVKAVESGSGTSCAVALPQLNLPRTAEVRRVEVAVESAQVQFDDQVLFLARFPGGWRVTAAGCVRDDPDPALPYKCEVRP